MQQPQSRTDSIQFYNGFPSQLFVMLERVSEDGMAHIVSWKSHGCAFKVHCKDQFIEEVLPRWFRHSNYNSFQRQLNIYGFRRFPEGPDKDAYYHENFVRGEFEQALQIGRVAVKGTRVRRPSNITSYPDFYNPVRDDGNNPSDAHSDGSTASLRFPSESSSRPQIPTASSISQRNIVPSALHPIGTQNSRRQLDAALLSSLGLASANPTDHNLSFRNDSVNALLPGILRRSASSNYMNLDEPSLFPFDQNSLESSLFRGLYPPRPLAELEQLVQVQAHLDSLQQQYRTQHQRPPFADERIMNQFTNMPVSPRQITDLQRRSLNPP